jgi:tetratricopeptide (TPR) repeat protein
MNVEQKLPRAGRGVERPAWLPEPRPPHLVLDEVGGAVGYVLWLLLNDCGLWIAAEARAGLFAADGRDWACDTWPAELEDAFSLLRAASAAPELARAADLARAAAAVWTWAEREQRAETALQFAELAARLEPDDSARATTAGRLARRRGLRARAAVWFSRGVRLARLRGNEIAFATAHLGWGVLEHNLGSFLHAEAHFSKAYRAAMRAGRRSLAGSAKHNLFGVAINSRRHDDAWAHAQDAVRLYPVHHPRFPLFAHDMAFLLNAQRNFSSALPLLERIAPMVGTAPERILVFATMARAAGAVRDRLRYERALAEILRLADDGSELAASSLYHAAEGARCFEQWARSAELARRALELARKWENKKTVVALAAELLDALSRREAGDDDVVPAEGGEVDQMVALLLKRLARHTAPPDRRAVPPEQFPVY